MDISTVLERAILSTDPTVRAEAESQLEIAARDHFVPFVGSLVEVLVNVNEKTEVRMLASIAFKNQLTSKNANTKAAQQQRWLSLDRATRSPIKLRALEALNSTDERVAGSSAQLVAAIAEIELPRDDWPELTGILVDNTRSEQPVHIKRASLLAIGYICESADPQNNGVFKQMDGFLTAIIQGAQSTETSTVVRLTAINALVNSLEFIRLNFANDNERDIIMQVVCEATQGQSAELQAGAFGALGRIMSLYYQYMQPYMEQALFGLTVTGMNSSNDSVTSMAVEFWSTTSEEELSILLDQEAEELGEAPMEPRRVNFNFARTALPQILPTVLNLLTRKDEEADDDEWSPSMAAGSCLQLLAQDTKDEIIPTTLTFISGRLQSQNWVDREAAVMAFGSILDGPDPNKLRDLIREALHPLLSLMNDPSTQVVDTVAWCLGRVADLVFDAIDINTDLPLMIEALLKGIRVHPKVSTNCCWAIMNLIEQLSPDPHKSTSPMAQFYPQLLPVLVESSARHDNEYSARTSAYEALSTMVIYSTEDVQAMILELSGAVLERLESTLAMQTRIVSVDDRANLEELQSNLLGLLTNIIRRVGEHVAPASDRLMTLFLELLQNKLPKSSIDEDVFIGVGAVAGAIGQQFSRFASAFIRYLVEALKEPGYQSSGTAVGLVADIAHAVGPEVAQYVPVLMQELIAILHSNEVRRELKPTVISCIGDIASSISEQFEPYLSGFNQILQTGSQLDISGSSSYDYVDYILNLREAILDAYVGIVAGLRDSPNVLQPYVTDIFNFLRLIYEDNELGKSEQTLRSAVGLLGDIASMYPRGEFSAAYRETWVTDMIRRARDRSFAANTRDNAKWAREQQKKQLSIHN